jgi:hypothetical protein
LQAKNFYGGHVGMLSSQLAKQAKRYHLKFGPGAVVFALGFGDGLRAAAAAGRGPWTGCGGGLGEGVALLSVEALEAAAGCGPQQQ